MRGRRGEGLVRDSEGQEGGGSGEGQEGGGSGEGQ